MNDNNINNIIDNTNNNYENINNINKDILDIDVEKYEEDNKTWESFNSEFSKIDLKAPEFVPQLSKDSLPEFTPTVDSVVPIDTKESILDRPIQELVGLDIATLRNTLMDEINSLASENEEVRTAQLQRIFGRLISFQPSDFEKTDDYFLQYEQRLYADLISTPGLLSNPYVSEFLKNDFYVDEKVINQDKRALLLKISDYYATHSASAIEKFNYVFKSSADVSVHLLNECHLTGLDLDSYFSERIMSLLDKEDLSQLYRFYYVGQKNTLKKLFSEENDKALFMITLMAKKVKSITGHSSEFLETGFYLMLNGNSENFNKLLTSFYDTFVIDKDQEEVFSKFMLQASNDKLVVMRDLMNYIITSGYDQGIADYRITQCTTVEEFLEVSPKAREMSHIFIFGKEGFEKVKQGTFDPQKDFKKITTNDELMQMKRSFFLNVYGISLEEAEHLVEHYGQYMDNLEKEVSEEDRETFEILKAIKNIYDIDMSQPNVDAKIALVQSVYYGLIKKNGLDFQESIAAATIVEGLCNNMFINTYNKRLFKIKDSETVLGVDQGVQLIDAGVDFSMMVTSLNGVGSFYSQSLNMQSKWNTSNFSNGQGLCGSYITSSNLGVIDLNGPILGFSHIPEYGLNVMGTSDVWTSTNYYNLRRNNDSRQGVNRKFIPAGIMDDESRYGYSEFLLDRFLSEDEDNRVKMQPDYVIVYKFDDNYQKTGIYAQSLKVAKEMKIPLVVVDIPKIKEHEKNEIQQMENTLFQSEQVDSSLVGQIVTRYMNNYTGSLTMHGVHGYRDFSVDGMEDFISKMYTKISQIEDEEERNKWISALEDAYLDEQRKYNDVLISGAYKYSVKSFILDTLDFRRTIDKLKKEFDPEKTETLDFTHPLDATPKLETIDSQQPLEAPVPFDVSEEDLESISFPQPLEPPEPFETSQSLDSDEDEYDYVSYDSLQGSSKYPYVDLGGGEGGYFCADGSLDAETRTIVDFTKMMEIGSEFIIHPNYTLGEETGEVIQMFEINDAESVLLENVIMSYFFENTSDALVERLIQEKLDSPSYENKFNSSSDFNLTQQVMQSTLFMDILDPNSPDSISLNPEKIDLFASKIESIDDKDFIKIFTPVIEKKASEGNMSKEEIIDNLLQKKANVRSSLNELRNIITYGDSGKSI